MGLKLSDWWGPVRNFLSMGITSAYFRGRRKVPTRNNTWNGLLVSGSREMGIKLSGSQLLEVGGCYVWGWE